MMPDDQSSVKIVGFAAASLVKDMCYFIKNSVGKNVEIIEPENFLSNGSCDNSHYLIGVTKDMHLRQQLIEHIDKSGYKKFTYVDPRAVINGQVSIGGGCFVGPFVFLAADSHVQDHCILSPYCMVSHRSVIGTGTIMQPHSMVAGTSTVGKHCKLNVRSIVLDFITLTDNVELGANALVTKDLTEPGHYLGAPARKKILVVDDKN